jgi:arginine exporter protein ArgO
MQLPVAAGSGLRTYGRFVGLTLLNPLTVTYFAALILGGGTGGARWEGRALFVLGAALASLSWQSLLAGLGALAHRRLPAAMRQVTSLVGNLIVIGLGIRLFWG